MAIVQKNIENNNWFDGSQRDNRFETDVKIFHHHIYRGFGLCEMLFNCFSSTFLLVDMPRKEMFLNFCNFFLIAPLLLIAPFL